MQTYIKIYFVYLILNIIYIFAYYVHFLDFCTLKLSIDA